MKVVINKCYGGFGLSDAAYEKLIEYGVPVQKYVEQKRGANGLYEKEPANEGEVLFDRTLSGDRLDVKFYGRYWETWLGSNRTHPLLIRVVEELGDKASGRFGELVVIEIPDGIEWEISDYDGIETIEELHRTWC